MKKLSIVAVLAILFATGCVQKSNEIYYWGEYQDIIYKMYEKPGDIDAQAQVDMINEDIIKAQDKGKKVPPGLYAHLGYIYYSLGNTVEAGKAFQNEKGLYPESVVFIDGIIQRASK